MIAIISRNASIRTKLMLSMAVCLFVFLVVSVALSVTLSGSAARTRVVERELPAVVGEIRNEIRHRIAVPLTASLAVANDTFLHAWESDGLPEAGVSSWLKYAGMVKQKNQADVVFWISDATGKYYTDKGFNMEMKRGVPDTAWFYGFLAGGKPYSMRVGTNIAHNGMMLYINARVDAAPGKAGVAGIGLGVDAMADSVRAYKIGQSGFVYLVRGDGGIVVHRDAKLADGSHNIRDLPGFSDALAKRLLAGEKFVHATYAAPDGKRLVASSFVPELDLYVIAEVPETEALGGIARDATISALVAALAGGAIGLALIWFVSRAIAAPVARAAALLGEIADGKGDLTRRMPVEGRDEVGMLAEAFNRFVSALNRTMSEVRGSTVAIAGASSEIAAGNGDLSSRTEQQSANLERTVTTIAQLTGTVQQNADHAKSANQLALAAREQAEKGGEVVGEVVATMGSITDSSRRIADIIGVIDGIAFQTNILALNAAVEAARAGEQGRGFAVVASEVRNLAQRSAAAAKEIKELISDSVDKVATGSRLVDTAGSTMGEIVASVRRVADLMGEIAAASAEQSEGIARVNGAIEEMDDSTRQNAALVEQAAAAAMALQDQSARLAQVVAAFRLEDGAR
ncbi:HAMP domain-containing protein [Massilia sp. TW-1]|uniref:HAMP domain-containing protein n=2 Tax=Telluria antibiotica TaxID=2717319 RepID=A0ABX0PL13_9BURK|nr:methyl-accepting chemotaxis protein [Telluria antibiotica]NIA57108.1 HAMP domain-containing protein [Telluria antibiotica]